MALWDPHWEKPMGWVQAASVSQERQAGFAGTGTDLQYPGLAWMATPSLIACREAVVHHCLCTRMRP